MSGAVSLAAKLATFAGHWQPQYATAAMRRVI
jgi:hypothetical protein